MGEYKNILVAVDGSREAEDALNKSIEFAKESEHTTLHIVYVIDDTLLGEDELSTIQTDQINSEKLLNGYKVKAQNEGVKNVEVIISSGSPQKIITEEIARLVKADLIICGATGLKGVEKFFLGSVSEAIVRTANCDVLVSRKNA
ncbi:universal stress protein [Sporosarcina sp. CAU 1771]